MVRLSARPVPTFPPKPRPAAGGSTSCGGRQAPGQADILPAPARRGGAGRGGARRTGPRRRAPRRAPPPPPQTPRQLDILKDLLNSIDEMNNPSFDALHAKIVGIREEGGGIRREIASLRDNLHGMDEKLHEKRDGMGEKLDALLQLAQYEANRSIFER